MMRVLVIDDDRLLMRAITLMLQTGGVEYETTGEGEAGFELARLYDYDAIILDLTLPDVSGHEVLRRLRDAHVETPVLILSGNSETATKVGTFGAGADDYMIKPFESDELIARLHALVRRSQGHAESVIRTGSMAIDITTRVVTVAGHRVPLTGKEYAMLELLSMRKGTTLTKEIFLTHLYGGRDEPEVKIIDVFICKLRKKLADADPNAALCIETVWGRGYALRDPEIEQAVSAA